MRVAHYATLILLLDLFTKPLWAEDLLTMGVFPRRNAVITHEMFQPLSQHLSESLGLEVKLEISKDFESFWSDVEKQRFDLVHFNQYHYLRAHKNHGYRVIVRNMEGGTPTSTGVLITRKDSGIASIQDLRDKEVVFGGSRKAMQSYIIATYILRQAGLKNGDYKEVLARNPVNSVLATYLHQADAAGAGMNVLNFQTLKKSADPDQLKILAYGPQLPHIPWAVSERISNPLEQRIRKLLINLDHSQEGVKLLKKMRINRFLSAENSDFDQHRKIVAEVLNEHY